MNAAGSRVPEIPGYRDLSRIGRGGFSVVYRGEQVSLGRVVAIKVLQADLEDADEVRRFTNECRILGQLGAHRHVVDVHDAGVTADGAPYIVMKFYGRGSLGERIKVSGPLPPNEVAAIGAKLAGALQAAHDIGVIHRDIKPDNVLVDDDGEPVLTDFGVAAIADAAGGYTSSVAFSHAHVAPEVLDRNAFGVASDIYSLGSTLYTLLTGRAAFAADTEARQIVAILNDPPPPIERPGVPDALADVIGTSMSKNPDDRYASAGDMRDALASVSVPTADPSLGRPTLVEPALDVVADVTPTVLQGEAPPHVGAVEADDQVTRRRSEPVGVVASAFPDHPAADVAHSAESSGRSRRVLIALDGMTRLGPRSQVVVGCHQAQA